MLTTIIAKVAIYKQLFTFEKKKNNKRANYEQMKKDEKLTIHEFDQAPQPQSVRGNCSQTVQHFQMDNG